MSRYKLGRTFALTALSLILATATAEAANCQGRRDTGTAVGAVGGGVIGNAASHGDAGGTIAGAVIGGLVGNAIGGSNCVQTTQKARPAVHYDRNGRAFYYDRYGHVHYYR